MKRKKPNCLIKLSGDQLSKNVLRWVKGLTKSHFVVICVGGGTQINSAFARAGIPVRKFGILGRECKTLRERQLARDVLERNRERVQRGLASIGASACVVVPVLEIGTVLCHVNGDQFVLTAYHGYETIYVVTSKPRVKIKTKQFLPYPKIKVVGF